MTEELHFSNSSIRRQDRLLGEEEAAALLRKGEYAFLSLVESRSGHTAAYGLPVSYAWDGGRHIYFHCAPEGHKLGCIDRWPQVSLCVVGRTRAIPDKFTTGYESVIVRGTMARKLPEAERMEAVRLLLRKYSAGFETTGMEYAAKSFGRTEILRMDIESSSGKSKRTGL